MIGSALTIHVQITLSAYGDALIYGSLDSGAYVPGLYLKQRLFAWHEESFYGTALEVQKLQEVELVVLPAEQVLPYFAKLPLLSHISWKWGEESLPFIEAAPALMELVRSRKFVPEFEAYREGRLQWLWESRQLEPVSRSVVAQLQEDPLFSAGIRSAFTAAVFQQSYGTEAAAADLRREYPLLFAADRSAAAGMDAEAWLLSIGWKADTAPFRPLLQLLEPEEEETHWRLSLVLQDKEDHSSLMPITLSGDGAASGSWPESWTPFVTERAAGWLERLRGALPDGMLSGGDDLFGEPLTGEEAWRFLSAESQRLLQTGWQVLLPAWWEAASRKRPRLRAKLRSGEGQERGQGSSLFGLDSLVNFDWRIAIGNADLSEAEFAQLVAQNQRLVKFRGQWIALDPALIAQIRQAMAGVDPSEGLSFQDILHLHLLESGQADEDESSSEDSEDKSPERIRLEVELNEHLLHLISQLGGQSEWPQMPVPAGLRADLRHYQHEGYSWLAFLRRFGLGACLADDMGLGKTIQYITYLLHMKEAAIEEARMQDGNRMEAVSEKDHDAGAGDQSRPARTPSLLICPTSVLGNWQKELSRFGPSIRVMLHYGSKRYSSEEFLAEAMEADLVLTSYATAALDQELLQGMKWDSICLDEAQNIKNAQTKQSTAVRSFPARHRIALTGTPIENKLAELWSIYDFINPGYLGGLRAFTQRFIQAIEKGQSEEKTADLQKLVKPFMLRRKKKDPHIQLDLPDKNEMKTYIHLTQEQGVLYDQTVNQLLEQMNKLEGIERKGAILSTLTRLKQLCDHPLLISREALPLKEKESAEGLSSRQLQPAGLAEQSALESDPAGEAATSRQGSKASSSTPQLDTESIISRSAKLERLIALVKELREEGERCLIFTQYIGMGEMLQQVLRQELGEPVLYLNGSTTKTARDKMIEQFQSQVLPAEQQPGVFILSLKAGGVGLNLTAANHVFHYDRWWNPAVENQATDRAYRMGQTKDVQVHKFIALGTLEERIDEMLESKQQLSDNIITSSEGWITELSTEELKDLFTLKRDWA
ncbi:SNF2-like protein [Paenibacillus algicola]|uniref:SNF2-like protein n=1 Tax=Paenibacillus algicola TaxID=2565926 RepID=A0A4P8XI09_9BACL|nr:DEAD/DEAH box helicase [Paenibacillus algicola]QCT01090.1 SNF2-like protein [Paenibacillus algicola]